MNCGVLRKFLTDLIFSLIGCSLHTSLLLGINSVSHSENTSFAASMSMSLLGSLSVCVKSGNILSFFYRMKNSELN